MKKYTNIFIIREMKIKGVMREGLLAINHNKLGGTRLALPL